MGKEGGGGIEGGIWLGRGEVGMGGGIFLSCHAGRDFGFWFGGERGGWEGGRDFCSWEGRVEKGRVRRGRGGGEGFGFWFWLGWERLLCVLCGKVGEVILGLCSV